METGFVGIVSFFKCRREI